jgi:hypothetical protein
VKSILELFLVHRREMLAHLHATHDKHKNCSCQATLVIEERHIAELTDAVAKLLPVAIVCTTDKPIPPIDGDRPGRGRVQRHVYHDGRLVPTDEYFDALNLANSNVCPKGYLQAKLVNGVAIVDFEPMDAEV